MNENYNITLLNTESDKLPDNLRIFGDGTFENCVKLAIFNMNINPGEGYHAGARAFKNCVSFANKELVGAMFRIGKEAFMNCTSLTGKITFNGSCVDFFDARIFAGCMDITELRFECRKGLLTSEFNPEAFVGMNIGAVKIHIVDPEGRDYNALNSTGVFDIIGQENVSIKYNT